MSQVVFTSKPGLASRQQPKCKGLDSVRSIFTFPICIFVIGIFSANIFAIDDVNYCEKYLGKAESSTFKLRTFSVLGHLGDIRVFEQVPIEYKASDLEWRIRFFISQAEVPRSYLRQTTWVERWEYLQLYTTPIWEMALADDSLLDPTTQALAVAHFKVLVDGLLQPIGTPEGLAFAGRWRSRFQLGSRIRQIYERSLLARNLKLQAAWWEVKQMTDELLVELDTISDSQQRVKRIQQAILKARRYPARSDQLAHLNNLLDAILAQERQQ
jgi:hypothetical protein